MAPHSSTLAWKIPWMEEPMGCSPWGRKESDTTEQLDFHLSLSCIGEGNGNPLQCSCLENPRDGGAWWAAVYGVAQSQTWLRKKNKTMSINCSISFPLLLGFPVFLIASSLIKILLNFSYFIEKQCPWVTAAPQAMYTFLSSWIFWIICIYCFNFLTKQIYKPPTKWASPLKSSWPWLTSFPTAVKL